MIPTNISKDDPFQQRTTSNRMWIIECIIYGKYYALTYAPRAPNSFRYIVFFLFNIGWIWQQQKAYHDYNKSSILDDYIYICIYVYIYVNIYSVNCCRILNTKVWCFTFSIVCQVHNACCVITSTQLIVLQPDEKVIYSNSYHWCHCPRASKAMVDLKVSSVYIPTLGENRDDGYVMFK